MLIHQRENSASSNQYKVTTYGKTGWDYHFHTSLELIYVFEGTLTLYINNEKACLTKDKFAIILSGQPHSINIESDSLVKICIFSDSFVKEFANMTEGKMGKNFVFSCAKEKSEFVKSILYMDNNVDVLDIKSMLYAVCTEYIKNDNLTERKDGKMGIETEMLKYIAENFSNDINMKSMADSLGYEYHYISKCFNKCFKLNFKNFLNQFRFSQAKKMLAKENMNMSEIAVKSGFQSIRNFNKVFKEISGEEPRNYSKNIHNISR